ncbi:hypothetical protein V8F33_008931 [Rhypophila sp. PSN 637]
MEARKRVSIGNLAFTWESQGRLDEAVDLIGRCVEFKQQILGPDHPHILSNILYCMNGNSE